MVEFGKRNRKFNKLLTLVSEYNRVKLINTIIVDSVLSDCVNGILDLLCGETHNVKMYKVYLLTVA